MYYVVGSGPSGIACAQAIADIGRPVTILEPGLTLEPEREALRAGLARQHSLNWPKPEFRLPHEGTVPVKLVHGSDYPYRLAPGATDICYSGRVSLQGSYAAGGLSNVWGGAILPYRQEDLSEWPITTAELQPAYANVSKLLPIVAECDDLAEMFPLHAHSYTTLRQSRQIEKLMQSLAKNRSKLNVNGVYFGKSRLAVDAVGVRSQTPCIYCGRCLHGCPFELIYSSRQSLENFQLHHRVSYIKGITVRSIEEIGASVLIRGVKFDGSPCYIEAGRVFLAAGVLNSTTILLRSLGLYDKTLTIMDSQYFLFPLLQFVASPNVSKEQLHTLCQLFIEILDTRISDHTIHLQIYSYNDHLAAILDYKLGFFKRFFPRSSLLDRLLLVQGYLHSAYSPSIGATLKRCGTSDALYLEAVENAQTKSKVLQVVRKLGGLAASMQATPITPLVEIAEPGRGFHSGGSFPMARAPGPWQSDRLGRPFGMERVHAVDSTVFPSIPATTITLTAMANAYRIGREVSVLDLGRQA